MRFCDLFFFVIGCVMLLTSSVYGISQDPYSFGAIICWSCLIGGTLMACISGMALFKD
jgi:hypothetical protein